MVRLVSLVLVAGCSYHPGIGTGDAPPEIPDQTVITGDSTIDCATWTSVHLDPCTLPPPPGDVHLAMAGSPYTYDTTTGGGALVDRDGAAVAITTGVHDQPGNEPAALWTTTGLAIDDGVELDVVGAKPLIIAAWNSIVVDGTIDAGSHTGVRTGAGADTSTCNPPGLGASGPSGTGGGGGGGFAGKGGLGGTGDGNGSACGGTCVGGNGGTAISVPPIISGGCSGSRSGIDTADGTATAFGAGGAGGGAILLVARIGIEVGGRVLAGGGGGGGDISNTFSYGGGGGGSGGLIGLEATSITVTGVLAANGGGGGGGAVKAAMATAGGDGQPSASAAAGGGGTQGEVGGAGSSQASLVGGDVTGTIPSGGGGGGGGGAGFVLRWSLAFDGTGATISPPLQAGP